MVPLLPKLRGQFAEFLNHSSLDRLSILYLTTCVGLGYGPCTNSLEAFLDSIGSPNSPQRLRITSQAHVVRICLHNALQAYTNYSISWPSYLPASPHRLTTTPKVPRSHHRKKSEEINNGFWMVSTDDSSLGADTRVREYQPVVHRLRLSASP